jgi:hypothetical protein
VNMCRCASSRGERSRRRCGDYTEVRSFRSAGVELDA